MASLSLAESLHHQLPKRTTRRATLCLESCLCSCARRLKRKNTYAGNLLILVSCTYVAEPTSNAGNGSIQRGACLRNLEAPVEVRPLKPRVWQPAGVSFFFFWLAPDVTFPPLPRSDRSGQEFPTIVGEASCLVFLLLAIGFSGFPGFLETGNNTG